MLYKPEPTTTSPFHPEQKVAPSPPSSTNQVEVKLVPYHPTAKKVGQVIPYIPGIPITQEQLDTMSEQQKLSPKMQAFQDRQNAMLKEAHAGEEPYQPNQQQQGGGGQHQQMQPVTMQPMEMQAAQSNGQPQAQLLNVGNMQPGENGPEIPPDQLHIFKDPIHKHMPKLMVRVEMGHGRNRWNAKENVLSDWWFYMCNNHEVLAMFFCHPGNITDKPARVVLLLFGFCFGLMFEVGISSLMKSDTDEFIVGSLLGLFTMVLFFFLEHFFTCSFIRGKMDEDEMKKLNEGHQLKDDQKFVRENGFVLARIVGGGMGCCCYLPGALGCFFGAVAIMANQRDISFTESYSVTTEIWLWGYASGAMYSLGICTAFFFWERRSEPEYKPPQVRKQIAQQRQSQMPV